MNITTKTTNVWRHQTLNMTSNLNNISLLTAAFKTKVSHISVKQKQNRACELYYYFSQNISLTSAHRSQILTDQKSKTSRSNSKTSSHNSAKIVSEGIFWSVEVCWSGDRKKRNQSFQIIRRVQNSGTHLEGERWRNHSDCLQLTSITVYRPALTFITCLR